MARFDVYGNSGKGRARTPYLLDVQSDFLDGLTTRVVVPLIDAASFAPVKLPADFTPSFDIGGVRCILHPAFIAAVPSSELGAKAGSLAEHHDEITAALDRLLGAY
ncbi:CcdB family protein [Caballeronia grimmiae]|uniref:Toxin CcdB n=1 Tax=Caballeronia grimmiae TaxID=1071679 RepID=A0A069NE39_9BURK|nr:CcdB family protein [Caballeronia grimmiae]KDR26605.1 cobalamin biosynthesis protein CbiX [Caballeronia grimmiae]GGD97032.1 plasmid maintenance protein CcdB [Caballeronia grimmiae]